MKENMIIACIPPVERNDYLTDTVFDGLRSMQDNGNPISFFVPNYNYPTRVDLSGVESLPIGDFIEKAKKADFILLFNAGPSINCELAEQIGLWERTFFIDGSELGKNKRLDSGIMKNLSEGTYSGKGEIKFDLLKKCVGYFRREPPYIDGVTPLPFGIEKKYIKYSNKTKKDIDFVCVFGQEEYPPLRKEVRLALEDYCKKNGFSFVTKQTKLPFFNIHSVIARWRFYRTLARAKVGISVAGGGFDTLRFWEVLANNCILITDKIGVYKEDSNRLKYDRIFEFTNLNDFKNQLEKVGSILRSNYDKVGMEESYRKIIGDHSTESRVMEIINTAKEKSLI